MTVSSFGSLRFSVQVRAIVCSVNCLRMRMLQEKPVWRLHWQLYYRTCLNFLFFLKTLKRRVVILDFPEGKCPESRKNYGFPPSHPNNGHRQKWHQQIFDKEVPFSTLEK